MPSTYAHRCFGRQVLAALPQEMQQLLRPEQALFSIGLHGPDILFFDHPLLGHVSRLGHRMHKQSGAAFFRPAGEKLAALEFPAPETAYLYGFLCHFALDRACHGYIAEQIARSGVAHTEIEVEFDRSLLVQAGLDPIRTSLTGHLHASARSAAVMAELLPDELTPRQTERAIRTFLRGNALFLAPGHCKRTVLYTGMRLAGAYHGLHGMIVNYEPNPKCTRAIWSCSACLTRPCRRRSRSSRSICPAFAGSCRGAASTTTRSAECSPSSAGTRQSAAS